MNQLQLASISLKVLGIYSIIRALVLSENFFQAILAIRLPSPAAPAGNHVLLILCSLVPIALLLGAGIFLILQSSRLAPLMAESASEDDGSGACITPHVFQSIAFSLLGLYLCVSAVPALFGIFWNILALSEAVPAEMRTKLATKSWALGARLCLQLVLGLWLFFGARGFSNLWFALLSLRERAGV